MERTTQTHQLKMADGRVLPVSEKTRPVRAALHTAWGPVVMNPISFAAMQGDDDVVLIGAPTLEKLGVDIYKNLGERVQEARAMNVRGVESPGFREARRVTMSVDALMHQAQPDPPDEAVERLVARGPDMIMSPAEEELGRVEALDRAVNSAAEAGLSSEGVNRLRNIVDKRWNAFRRALRGDPPARVEPLKVIQKPAKARLRSYSQCKTTSWLLA